MNCLIFDSQNRIIKQLYYTHINICILNPEHLSGFRGHIFVCTPVYRLINSLLSKATSLQSVQETCIEAEEVDLSSPVGGSQARGIQTW